MYSISMNHSLTPYQSCENWYQSCVGGQDDSSDVQVTANRVIMRWKLDLGIKLTPRLNECQGVPNLDVISCKP